MSKRELDFQAVAERTGNLCLNFCKGACCKDITHYNLPQDQFERLSAEASVKVQKDTVGQVLDVIYQTPFAEKGIYFTVSEKGRITAGIKGDCPNLQQDGACGIHDVRPDTCRNLAVGGEGCRISRRTEGLKPLEKVIPRDIKQSVGRLPLPIPRAS